MPGRRSHLAGIGLTLALVTVLLLTIPSGTEARTEVVGQEGLTTVFLVRHAEKSQAPESDPILNGRGEERATELLHVLEEAGVTAIYSSQFRRTQDTVRPLADRLGLELDIIPAAESARLVETIRQNHRGDVVVVCGHSNTVPEIIEELGAGRVDPIEESNEYDNLYVVRLFDGGTAQVTTLKYGRRPQ